MTGSTWRSPRNTPLTLTPITCVEHRLVVFGGRRDLALDAGVVEEAVDAAVGVERRLDVVLHVGRFGDVGGDETRLAALLPDDAGGRSPAGAVAVDDDDLGAALRRNASAVARPMPLPAPVISATLPVKSMGFLQSCASVVRRG